MTPKQIYATMNNMRKHMFGDTTAEVVNYSTFVSFGNDVISSSANKEQFYNTLADLIGRTIIDIRKYSADKRNVLVDSFTFGSILQQISFKLQDAQQNSDWTVGEVPYNRMPKGGVIQKLYAQSMPTYSYEDVISERQIESAFRSPESMAGFINGIYTRMANAGEVDKENMISNAVCALACKVASQATGEHAENTARMVNLYTAYKAINPTWNVTSLDSAMRDKDFLEFVCVEMGSIIPFIEKLTPNYNDGTVERHTPRENLVVEVNDKFEKAYSVYLKSNTFHEEMVALPQYNTVPYWFDSAEPTTIEGKFDASDDYTINGVIAIMRDENAVKCTLDRERVVAFYDQWNDRTPIKHTYEKRYIVDSSQNCIIFYYDATADVTE